MKLKCRIHENEYDIVSGATFSEEYNETLDSGSIILDHIAKIPNLRPYDDVYIWNSDEEFNGYYNVGDEVPTNFLNNVFDFNIYTTRTNPFVETTSYNVSITQNGSDFLFSSYLIDLWISGLFYGINTVRWSMPRLTFKFTLKKITQGNNSSSVIGYYYLSNNYEDNKLQLIKDSNYTSDSSLSDRIIASAEAKLRNTLFFSQQANLTLNGTVYDATTQEAYTVENIEALSSYDLGCFIYAKTNANLSISNITDEEILSLKDLKITGLCNGGLVEFVSDEVQIINNSELNISFRYILDKNIWFFLPFEKQSDGSWLSNGDLCITENNVDYWFDFITEPIDRDAFIVISSAQTVILPSFFKHLLVDSFTCEMVDLDKQNYKYKISLMSETKRLEKTILPNISITQPIVGDKRTIWYYLNQYVNLYSPKVKMMVNGNQWKYVNKYKIDMRDPGDYDSVDTLLRVPVHEIFDDSIYAPEMSLTAPTLKDILSRLMTVKDCIPVVKNDVIYAMKISDVHGEFLIDNNKFSFITQTMDSGEYSTAFRREYGGAISQKNSAHMVEYLGFRNKNSALLTLDNMYLETRFPIYKINKATMLYYKKVTVRNKLTNEIYDKLVLIKHDISRLILQSTVRDALVADWTKIPSIRVEDMNQYRIYTLGYNIGSTQIEGWGEKFDYVNDILGWTKETDTYLEVILNALENEDKGGAMYGDDGIQFLGENETLEHKASDGWKNTIVTPNGSGNVSDALKSIFFQIDYIAMYSGAVIHSKENNENDDIQTSDNCSASLSVLEVDGLFEKEKANRLANETTNLIARFNDYHEMNDTYNNVLGSKLELDDDSNIIIYHREYQIYDDCVLANFLGTHDYVMKNYFTTVFARYRTYSYASYNESVQRSENDKYTLILSDDSCVFEEDTKLVDIQSLLSAFTITTITDDLKIQYPKQINGGYFTFYDKNGNKEDYFSDVNQFVSGYSLCFNIRAFGSITNGNYISSLNCFVNKQQEQEEEQEEEEEQQSQQLYVGSSQGWYKMPVEENDGFLEKMGCYFAHFENEEHFPTLIDHWVDSSGNREQLYKNILELPKKQWNVDTSKGELSFGKVYNFCKDDKEIIDFTLQYELVNNDKDVLFSEWLIKLTDFNSYVKLPNEVQILDRETTADNCVVRFYSVEDGWNLFYFLMYNSGVIYKKVIELQITDPNTLSYLQEGFEFRNCNSNVPFTSKFNIPPAQPGGASSIIDYIVSIALRKITEITRDGNNAITGMKIQAEYTIINNFTTGITSGQSKTITFGELTFEPLGNGSFRCETLNFLNVANPPVDLVISETINNSRSGSDPDINYGAIMGRDIKYFSFLKTMYIIASTKKIDQTLLYSQYKLDELPDDFTIINTAQDGVPFNDIFSVKIDENGRPYIMFKANPNLGDNYQSIQYWYYDPTKEEVGDFYANGDGYLHFVFGVNKEKADGDAKIYVSIVKNRNKDVYNQLHRKIGTILNCATQENEDKYGVQYYEEEQQ